MIEDVAPTIHPGPSRYTLTPTPDDPKNRKRKSPAVRDKPPERKKQAAFATTSGVILTHDDQLQAPTTKPDLIRPDQQQYQPEEVSIIAGPSNAHPAGRHHHPAAKRQAASASRPRPKPSRAKETHRMNRAIAAGAPVIFTRDEAERERVIREIRHANKVLVEGLAPAKVGKAAAKGKGKETDGDKGMGKWKGKGKEKEEVDRDERHRNVYYQEEEKKPKQTTTTTPPEDQRKKKKQKSTTRMRKRNLFSCWFRRKSSSSSSSSSPSK